MTRVVGILLAAGRGTRFGSDKRLAPLADGQAVAVAACRNLRAALPEVVAVVRPEDSSLASVLAKAGARVIRCTDADQGMGRTLACGVGAASDAGGWVVALADMPWIAPSTIAEVAARVARGASAAAPRCGGKRGHPVGFGREHLDALLALQGDRGARELLASTAVAVELFDVDDQGVLRDVDVPADLR
jgi:molybdenum cofactor cytidylyltransferase